MARRISLKSQRGQAVTEFAFVLPILALLLFGVIQFGIVFNDYLSLTDATRAGARKAVVSRHEACPGCVAEDAVRNAASDLTQSALDVNVSTSGGWEPGSDVTVRTEYPYSISLLGFVVTSGDLSSETTERIE